MTTTSEPPKYPTFYDEILAAIPTDRWITSKELWKILKPRGMSRQYIKTCLYRAKRAGLIIAENTYQKVSVDWRKGVEYPIYRYVRIASGRPISEDGGANWHSSRKKVRGQKHNMNKKPWEK